MPTVTYGSNTYDVNSDFTWKELIEVEDRSGHPLADEKSFAYTATYAALIYVIRKRTEPDLDWVTFLKEPLPQPDPDEPDEPDTAGTAKAKAKPRPTKPSA